MKKYGLLGEKLGHSYSPLIHSMLGDYKYDLTELSPEDAEEFLKNHDFTAYNVTIPYKKLALKCCDIVSPEAEHIGSVNTLVVNSDNKLCGFNTDAFGFEYLLSEISADPKGKKCVILGNGGASVTVQYVLDKLGASSVIAFDLYSGEPYENLPLHYDAEIIVNATPVGMFPHNGKTLVDLEKFQNCSAVIDVVYNPAKTKLILDAERLNIPCISGLAMLVAQAKQAYEIFFGTERDNSIIADIVKKINSDTLNILLVGMPGCGKSTIGALLSKKTGRELLDTDDLIKEKTGRLPGDIINTEGEPAFRKIESAVLEEVSKLSSKIIATGGGIVTVPENEDLLRQNSTVFFIDRDLTELDTSGRPLSANGKLPLLYEKRYPLYKKVSDHILKFESSAQCAADILELLGI